MLIFGYLNISLNCGKCDTVHGCRSSPTFEKSVVFIVVTALDIIKYVAAILKTYMLTIQTVKYSFLLITSK